MPREVTVYANATKAAMQAQGVSMREIARDLGVSHTAVEKYFAGIDRNLDFEAYCLERFNVDWDDPTALCGEANPPVITGKDKGKWSEWLPIIDEARGPRPVGMGSNLWLETVAAKHGKSARQLYRKVKELDGMRLRDAAIEIAAAAKAPAQMFALTSTSFDGEALKWAFRQWLDQPHFWTMRELYEATCDEAARHDWRTGAYTTFCRVFDSRERYFDRRAEAGLRGVKTDALPPTRRNYDLLNPLDCAIGDQTVYDYVVKDEFGNAFRPEGYMVIDLASSYAFVTPVIGHYNRHHVGATFKQAFRFGLFARVYTDQGKPEKSKHVTGVISRLSGLVQFGRFGQMFKEYEGADANESDEEIERIYAAGRWPRGKRIETLNNTLQIWLKNKLKSRGYAKRHKDSIAGEVREAELREAKRHGDLPTVDEFFAAVQEVVEKWNTHLLKPQSGKPYVPRDRFFAGLGVRPVLSDAELDWACLQHKIYTIRQSTIGFRWENELYTYEAPQFVSASIQGADERKRKVVACFDPWQPDRVACYSLDGEFLAYAERSLPVDSLNWEEAEARRQKARRVMAPFEDLYKRELKTAKVRNPKLSVTTITPMTTQTQKAERERAAIANIKATVTDKDKRREANNALILAAAASDFD